MPNLMNTNPVRLKPNNSSQWPVPRRVAASWGLVRILICAALVAVGATAIVGCMRTITPAEIRQLGTKPFPGHGRVQVAKASVAALKVLGYQVVADQSAPRIRTAPKLIQVYASGTTYSVTTISDALAWSIEVTRDAKGSILRAEPRAYRNGQPLDFDQVGYDYMERAFSELYREIDDNLKGK